MKLPTFKRRTWIIVIVILAMLAFFYFQSRDGERYTPYTVESRDMVESLELSGEVVAASSATLRFGAGGYVTYLGAKEGDAVKKWQTLASVDTRQLQKLLEQRLNLYSIQRGQFDQTIDDNDNAVPDGDLARQLNRLLAKNQYQLSNTVLDVEYQDLSIKLARLTSPVAGILIQAPTSVANVQVSPTDSWVVVDPTTLEFVADLDETDIGRIREGQKVTVTLDAYPDRDIESTITHISYSPKETTTGTTYEVRISIPAGEMQELRLGLNGTAKVQLADRQDVATLPLEAIAYETVGTLVYTQEGKEYKPLTVTTGVEDDGFVEVVEGPSIGDVVYAKKQE